MQPSPAFVARRTYYRRLRRRGLAGLQGIAALNRINALACIRSAGRGWIGACYSSAELLTALYFGLGRRDVVLSKGHAAPMQYACLYGLGLLGEGALASYKDGPSGLQAHTDVSTPGILVNTGSLGQALSKAAGLAWARPRRRHAVILGDGELQEGQNFEAFQTICHRGLRNLDVIVDLNGFQSERRVAAVKRIRDRRRLFEGFGFEVAEVDGHDVRAVVSVLRRPRRRPLLVLARTRKAGGTRWLPSEGDRHPWHAGVPSRDLALEIAEEQALKAGEPGLLRELREFRRGLGPAGPEPPSRLPGSTRDWFSDELKRLSRRDPRILILDADLAGSCGLGGLREGRDPFLELGISEQDMVGFAGGLALAGRLPVVHTYAAFFKRAYEQICSNQTEGRKILYAGHYAGLCYHTDGKSHQSISDLSLMRTVPGLIVVEPVDEEQTRSLLRWAVREAPASVYFRLRRTPAGIRLGGGADPRRPAVLGAPGGGRASRAFLTAGTVATALALRARREKDFAGHALIVQSVFNHELDLPYYRRALSGVRELTVIEDNVEPGGLYEFACGLAQRLGSRARVRGLSVRGFGPSFRTLEECLQYHGLTIQRLRQQRHER